MLLSDIPHMIMLLLMLGFWVVIVWAIIKLVRTLQRIAASLEQLVKSNDERLKH